MHHPVAEEFRSVIAQRLRSEHTELAARWLSRLAAILPVDPNQVFPTDHLLDHIPELIVEIAEYLEWPEREEIAGNAHVIAKARELGTPSDFSGYGPKCQRSDERLREQVCDRLTSDPFVDATDIDVRVEYREVTLEGLVRTRDQRRRGIDTGCQRRDESSALRMTDLGRAERRTFRCAQRALNCAPPSSPSEQP